MKKNNTFIVISIIVAILNVASLIIIFGNIDLDWIRTISTLSSLFFIFYVVTGRDKRGKN